MWGTEWPKLNIVVQGKYFLWTMTSNSLTENEEHGIPSQILKTIFGLHASVIFRPQYVWFPVHLKGHLIPLCYQTLVVNWQNWLFTLFHQSRSVLSPNPISRTNCLCYSTRVDMYSHQILLTKIYMNIWCHWATKLICISNYRWVSARKM